MNEDGHLDWGAGSQHTDLHEDLDALVDPETQRIMDEGGSSGICAPFSASLCRLRHY